MSKYFSSIGSMIFYLVFGMHAASDQECQKISKGLQVNEQGYAQPPLGRCVTNRYAHAQDRTVSLSLCKDCNYNCLQTISYRGFQIDQLVFFHTRDRFIKALFYNKPVDHKNGILQMLTIMESYSVNGPVNYAQKLSNGDYNSKVPPLHIAAAKHTDIQAAQILVDYGANVNRLDYTEKTPLDQAINADNPAMISFLTKIGGKCADPQALRHLIRIRYLRPIILPNKKIA